MAGGVSGCGGPLGACGEASGGGERLVRKLGLVKGSTWVGRRLGSILGPLSCVQMGRICTSYLETCISSLGSAPLLLAGAALGYDPHCPGHLSWIPHSGACAIEKKEGTS